MNAPAVYIFHGDDQYAIQQQVAEMMARLNANGMADLNTTRLEGSNISLNEVRNAASTLPFLAERRLVIWFNPLNGIHSQQQRQDLQAFLEQVPGTSALVLWFPEALDDPELPFREHGLKAPKKEHWLVRWAKAHSEQVYLRGFLRPVGAAMARWIQTYIHSQGGEITPQAAALLASLVGADTSAAANESEKLLAYVNARRAIDEADVDLLVTNNTETNVFDMVDALGHQQGKKALALLTRLLEEQDGMMLFGMVVRQFRLLLLAREVLEEGGRDQDIAARLKIHPYVARKIVPQAQQFSLASLEDIYHTLVALDEAIKTGQNDPVTALSTLTAAITPA
ncbi:MAG: DNA polymerase III subunit delta [Anaerolineales bacterium]